MKIMICFKPMLLAAAQSLSGYKLLFLFALLAFVSAPTYSQQSSKKSGWAINNTNTADSSTEDVESVPDAGIDIVEREQESRVETNSKIAIQFDKSGANNQSVAAEGATSQPVRPVVNVDPQLRKDLEAQYQRMRRRVETEDAFSEALGEEYLSYGLLLKQAGRLDEARKMFIDAQHIVKVNNGVYAIEQRPTLRALFETNYLSGKTADAEAVMEKIIWLENQHPDVRDNYSFDMVLKLGNHFLDLYVANPTDGETGKLLLDDADKYLSYAVRQYGATPISEALMPYGELALLHLYKSRLDLRTKSPFAHERRTRPFSQGGLAPGVENEIETKKYYEQAFSKSEFYLKLHLKKAKKEENIEEAVWSLIGLGDVNLLFGRKFSAAEYYKLAWLEAEKLPTDHPIALSFDQTHALPKFRHALRRTGTRDNVVLMPLTIDINQDGKVTKINKYDKEQENSNLFPRARRITKRTVFRPIIENGSMVGIDQHLYELHLPVRKKKSS